MLLGVLVTSPAASVPRPKEPSRRIALLFTTLCLTFVVPLLVGGAFSGPQAQVSETEKLIRQAYYFGTRYLSSHEKNWKKQAGDLLEQARKVSRQELKKNSSCESCEVNLARIQFYEALFQLDKNYGDCFDALNRARARYPNNATLALVDGYASHNTGQWPRAIQSLQEFLILSSGEPEKEDQARQLLEFSRSQFLNVWYAHGNFYQSEDSVFKILNPNTFRNEIVFQVTPEWERNLGQHAFVQLTENTRVIQDPELQPYLHQLVSRLVEKTPGPFPNYQVTVVDSLAVNAVTTPGHVVVFTGLIGFVETEAQLASVLAHELAHNYGHHSARRFLQALKARTAAANIINAINPQSFKGQLIADLVSTIGIDLFVRAYTRFEEKEADLYGAHISFNAGYDPMAATEVFLEMFKQNPKQGIKFLSTHPPMPNRIEYISDYLGNFPLDQEMRSNSEEFLRIKARFAPAGGPAGQLPPGKAVLPPN